MQNQEIRCTVQSCKFNDKVKYCTLQDITVGKTKMEAHAKCDTECASFEE